MTVEPSPAPRRRRALLLALLLLVILVAVLLLLRYCQLTPETTARAPHPLGQAPTLTLGNAVVTGFSGTAPAIANPAVAAGKSPADENFINQAGPSARIFDPTEPGFIWNGNYWALPYRRDIFARDVGQVFGVAIDDDLYPNIYLAATSVYGLNLVVQRQPNVPPERVRKGEAHAQWMAGQFGQRGGPGSIWKVDGRDGTVSLFANVTLSGRENAAAGLGNLAYDPVHKQLFVSDRGTGMVHRFDLGGNDLGHYDHGMNARRAANLSAVAYDSITRADIVSPKFDSEDPKTWGLAPAERQVWGLAVHNDRLYYAAGGQIWSVGLDKDGNFADSRFEVDLPGGASAPPVSDIVFNKQGQMIVAQRAVIATHYDYTALPPIGAAHVYRFTLEMPADPKTPNIFYDQPEEFAVGFAGDSRSTDGGVALGYGYDNDGKIVLTDCESALWATGENLRDFHAVGDHFEPSGPLLAQGVQISPSGPVRAFNTPPKASYIADYDNKMESGQSSGKLGGVRVYALECGGEVSCWTAPAGGVLTMPSAPAPSAAPETQSQPSTPTPEPTPTPTPTPTPGGCTPGEPGCTPCTPGEPGCGPCIPGEPGCGPCIPGTPGCGPPPQQCMDIKGKAVCDPETGTWVFKITVNDMSGIGIDTINAYANQPPGVSVSNGPKISLVPPPGIIDLSGASSGDTVTIDVCGFNSAAADSGKPYDCCRARLTLRVPERICKPSGDHPKRR